MNSIVRAAQAGLLVFALTAPLQSRASVDASGWGASSALGIGEATNSAEPIKAVGLTYVVAISIGHFFHTLAARADGTAWAWGMNTYGQLGDGTNQP